MPILHLTPYQVQAMILDQRKVIDILQDYNVSYSCYRLQCRKWASVRPLRKCRTYSPELKQAIVEATGTALELAQQFDVPIHAIYDARKQLRPKVKKQAVVKIHNPKITPKSAKPRVESKTKPIASTRIDELDYALIAKNTALLAERQTAIAPDIARRQAAEASAQVQLRELLFTKPAQRKPVSHILAWIDGKWV